MKVKIFPEKVFNFLFVIIAVLSIMNIIASYLHFNSDTLFSNIFFKLFDVNTEVNIPSLYSTIALLACAALLFLIHFIEDGQWEWVGYWSLLGFVFLFLAIDENISLHEKIMGLVRNQFHLSGFFYYAWIVPYFFALFLLGIYYLPFLVRLPRNVLYYFITAFFLFTGGAIGMEMLGGRHDSLYGHDRILVLYYSIEEFLEMVGIAVFIKGLLLYIAVSKASGKVKLNVQTAHKIGLQTAREEA